MKPSVKNTPKFHVRPPVEKQGENPAENQTAQQGACRTIKKGK
jgi:hypothetical protein